MISSGLMSPMGTLGQIATRNADDASNGIDAELPNSQTFVIKQTHS